MSGYILVGVVTSIVGALLGQWCICSYGKLRDGWFYRGPKIEGEWESTLRFSDDTYNKMVLSLTRRGWSVEANMRCIEGYSKGINFTFKGEIYAHILTGTYRASDPSKSERGAIALMLVGNGTSLQGYVLYTEDTMNEVRVTECKATRVTSATVTGAGSATR